MLTLALWLVGFACSGEKGATAESGDPGPDGAGDSGSSAQEHDSGDERSATILLPSHLWFRDRDGDGYGDPAHPLAAGDVAPEGYVGQVHDCDDTDPDIHPGAVERCDDVDQDCDGSVDDDAIDATVWYADADADGFGDIWSSASTCEPPAGWGVDSSDCDDTNPDIHPGVDELCGDDIDNDCDGEIDEVPEDYGDWRYPDLDHDRYGDDDAALAACTAPSWYIEIGGDCDDTDVLVRPGAHEFCDGVDHDCDGLIDSDDPDNTSTWYVDDDGDGYGSDEVEVDGCEAPDGATEEDGDCDETDPDVSPGEDETCGDAIDEDCDGLASSCGFWGDHGLDEVGVTYVGGEPQGLGDAVAAAGDVDGDGLDDLWLAAPDANLERGSVYLVLGGTSSGTVEDCAMATLEGTSVDGQAGYSLAVAGDVNADGYADLWIGIPFDVDDGSYVGSATLEFGPFSDTRDLAGADLIWMGIDEYDQAGYRIAADADLNEDGTVDAVVSANRRELTDGSRGSVYLLITDGTWGTRDLSIADYELVGEATYDQLGRELATADDVTGDGVADVLIGSTANDGGGSTSGAVYVLSEMPAAGSYDVADVTHRIVGEKSDLGFGSGLAAVSDLNGDGYGDIAVGASGDSTDAEGAGAVFVLWGPTDDLDSGADAAVKLAGVEEDENATMVDGGLDIDADGWGDLIVGAYYDGGGGDLPGKAYLLHGPLDEGTRSLGSADALYLGEQARSYAGRGVAMVGDTNGDAYGDLVVGAPHTGDDSQGTVYLLLGDAFGG